MGSGPANDAPGDATDTQDIRIAVVDIDCNASRVRVTAPNDYEYGLTVSFVDVTRSGTSSSTTSRTPFSGNATVEFSGEGVVYAAVTDETTGKPITTAVARCGEPSGANATNATDGPSISVDCNESVVGFTADEGVTYTAQVASVDPSGGGSSISSLRLTAEGNTTLSVEDGLVIAFAFTEGADEPVSVVRDCGRIGDDDTETTG